MCKIVQKCTNSVIRSKLLYHTVGCVENELENCVCTKYRRLSQFLFIDLQSTKKVTPTLSVHTAFDLLLLRKLQMQLWVDYDCIVLLITHTFHCASCLFS